LNVRSNFRCHLQIFKSSNQPIPIIANEQCSLQVRYAAQEISQDKSARARGSYLRVSFKNTRETAQAINGMKLSKALTFLENVTTKTMAVPMRRYAGSTGRTAQGESPFFSRENFRNLDGGFGRGIADSTTAICDGER
jgi:hypothetical protein